MGDKLTVDKVFADNLGTAIGGCVRDQSVTLFSSDIARAAGVPGIRFPSSGVRRKRAFAPAGPRSFRAWASGRR